MIKDIQGDRQCSGIGIYWSRLSWARSFTWALKISTNTASNYTAINKPVAPVQMRKPKRVHTRDGAIARRLNNCSLEPSPRGPAGGTGMLCPPLTGGSRHGSAQPFPAQALNHKCLNSGKINVFAPLPHLPEDDDLHCNSNSELIQVHNPENHSISVLIRFGNSPCPGSNT